MRKQFKTIFPLQVSVIWCQLPDESSQLTHVAANYE
jgi:hypothetical protein